MAKSIFLVYKARDAICLQGNKFLHALKDKNSNQTMLKQLKAKDIIINYIQQVGVLRFNVN